MSRDSPRNIRNLKLLMKNLYPIQQLRILFITIRNYLNFIIFR